MHNRYANSGKIEKIIKRLLEDLAKPVFNGHTIVLI